MGPVRSGGESSLGAAGLQGREEAPLARQIGQEHWPAAIEGIRMPGTVLLLIEPYAFVGIVVLEAEKHTWCT